MIRWIASALIAIMLSANAAATTPTTYVVRESTLNKFASAVGPMSGNAGRYEFAVEYPCFPDFWNLCRVVIYGNDLLWTLANPSFSVSNSGVNFTGNLRATFGIFTYNTQITGPVFVDYTNGAFSLNVSQVSVPITVLLPWPFNAWTIATLPIGPNYNGVYPAGAFLLNVAARGGSQGIQVAPMSVGISYQPGAVILNLEYVAW